MFIKYVNFVTTKSYVGRGSSDVGGYQLSVPRAHSTGRLSRAQGVSEARWTLCLDSVDPLSQITLGAVLGHRGSRPTFNPTQLGLRLLVFMVYIYI